MTRGLEEEVTGVSESSIDSIDLVEIRRTQRVSRPSQRAQGYPVNSLPNPVRKSRRILRRPITPPPIQKRAPTPPSTQSVPNSQVNPYNSTQDTQISEPSASSQPARASQRRKALPAWKIEYNSYSGAGSREIKRDVLLNTIGQNERYSASERLSIPLRSSVLQTEAFK